jgi:hypothetical protein
MHKTPQTLRSIDLQHVTGGWTSPPGMAPPKYSAGWWDLVRKNTQQR